MEYVKGNPYFCKANKRIKQYRYLNKDIKCDVLIIGGGIDGAICNYYLSKKYDTVLVDKSRFGFSCTSCATALLEYQLDEFAMDLTKYLPIETIVEVYKMGQKSIKKINNFIKENGNKCYFNLRPTFLYTNSIFDKQKIIEEYNFRKKNGFNVKLILENNNPFPFQVKAGIYAKDGGCEFNPYLFTKQMIENSCNQSNLYENTKIENLSVDEDKVTATTNFGNKIVCNKVVIATGFNFELINKNKICQRFVSYTITTKPIKNLKYYNSALVHDNSAPYHYLRTLNNGALIFGGEDTKLNGKVGIKTKLANKKYKSLEENLKSLFKDFEDEIEIDSRFCGAFGTTDNNLGLIGKSNVKNVYYFISCGANGIINAMYGVELLDDLFNNRENKLEKAFSPIREK